MSETKNEKRTKNYIYRFELANYTSVDLQGKETKGETYRWFKYPANPRWYTIPELVYLHEIEQNDLRKLEEIK